MQNIRFSVSRCSIHRPVLSALVTQCQKQRSFSVMVCRATTSPPQSARNPQTTHAATPSGRLDSFLVEHRQRTVQLLARRSMATRRGARGHGWYVNYRAGKGGHRLQGRFFERESLAECTDWNASVMELGSTAVYMDVVLEPKTAESYLSAVEQESLAMEQHLKDPSLLTKEMECEGNVRPNNLDRGTLHRKAYVPPLDSLQGSRHRIVIDLASAVMPESSDNFIKLCQLEKFGYKGTKLFRFERNVGACGGDVVTNLGRTGLAAPHEYSEQDKKHFLVKNAEPLRRTILRDPLVLWHLPGTVTMLVQRVDEVDSRFLLLTNQAMHMDGIHRAIGQMRPESLQQLQNWQENLKVRNAGFPTTYDLVVADCGLLTE